MYKWFCYASNIPTEFHTDFTNHFAVGIHRKKARRRTPEIMQSLLGKSQLSERHYPLLVPGKWRSTYAWAQTCLPRHYSRRPSAKCWQTKNKWLVALEFGIGRWQSHYVWVRYFGFEDKLPKKKNGCDHRKGDMRMYRVNIKITGLICSGFTTKYFYYNWPRTSFNSLNAKEFKPPRQFTFMFTTNKSMTKCGVVVYFLHVRCDQP